MMSRQAGERTTLFLVALISIAVGSALPAQAHTRNTKGHWLFSGSTYKTKEFGSENRSDPLALIWAGPDSVGVTYSGVARHLSDDWRPRYGTWGTRNRNRLCRAKQAIHYAAPGGGGSWANFTFTGSTSSKCGKQYHSRYWSDVTHNNLWGSGHPDFQWVVGGIHHEHPITRLVCFGSGTTRACTLKPDHKIDMPWDDARVIAYYAMRTHCRVRHWAVQPGAKHWYGNFENSGMITRISTRHRSQGCDLGY